MKKTKQKKKLDKIDWLLRIIAILGLVGTIYFGYTPVKNYFTAKSNEKKIEQVAKKTVKNTNNYTDVGSIFLDSKADNNFNDNLNFIFGHNTYLDNKFSQLRKYSDKDFNNSNKEFYIFTDKNEKITYKVIGQGLIPPIFPLYTEEKVKFDVDNLTDYQKYIKEYTDITQENIEDIHVKSKLTVLTTCLSSTDSSGRQIVIGLEVNREKY